MVLERRGGAGIPVRVGTPTENLTLINGTLYIKPEITD